jgi:hypothetical protein
MKSVLSKFLQAYFFIGCVFALIMWSTYMWTIGWGAPEGASFGDKLSAQFTMQPVFIFSAFVRMVLWLPSLLIWFLTPNSTSFGMWLAPGLYTETLVTGQ